MMKWLVKFGNRRFLLFTLILLLKCSLAWLVIFEDGPSWSTMLTEIPFFWIVFFLIEWFATKRKLIYYAVANLMFTLLFFTALMYYKYYGIIVTYHALNQADKVTKVGESTYSLMDPHYLLMFVDIIVFVFVYLLIRKKIGKIGAIKFKPYHKRAVMTLFVASVLLCYFNIWPNRASMNENKQAEDMGILNYEIYTIFSDSIQEAEMIEMEDITQPAINELKGITPSANPHYFGAAKGKNVIVIQLESFQNFLVGLTIDGQEVTPNMNQLAKDSFYYNNFYTMVGQGTTSDAEFVVNTSLYVPEHEPATKENVKKILPSLPKLLRNQGYTTATFHTNDVSFWNRKELYSAIGWERYYDRSFFGEGDHVAFGASDEVLYTKTFDELKNINERGRPFYSQIISMSSHHPYNLPKNKVRMELPSHLEDTLIGHYIQSQNYSDHALGQFINQLKESGIWNNSVVLLYGDHQGLPVYSLDKEEKEIMKGILGHEYEYPDVFNIPFILHAPGVTYPSVIPKTGGQIDILPTVANLVGISLDEQIHFGTDLLNSSTQSSNILPMRHFLPSGSFITDTKLFVPGEDFADGTNYSLGGDSEQAYEEASQEQFDHALELLQLSDSYIRQLADKEQNK